MYTMTDVHPEQTQEAGLVRNKDFAVVDKGSGLFRRKAENWGRMEPDMEGFESHHRGVVHRDPYTEREVVQHR